MKSKIKQSLFLIIASLLAVFFVVVTVKQIDFERVAKVLKQTNYFWIFASMAISILTYWIRAARWNLLLKPMGYNTQTSSGFWAIAFAYFMNLTIPRSGEVARATSFYKMEKVPFEKSFGTVVLERVIDVLFLGLFFGLTLIFNYETFIKFVELGNKEKAHQPTTEPSFLKYYIAIGVLVLGIGLIAIFWKKISQLKFFEKIKTFLFGLWEGIKSISKLEKRGLFIFYSFALWICYFLMTFLVLRFSGHQKFWNTRRFIPIDCRISRNDFTCFGRFGLSVYYVDCIFGSLFSKRRRSARRTSNWRLFWINPLYSSSCIND